MKMELLRNEDVTVNLALFKRFYFYHLFDPNSKKILNYNIYKVICVVFILISFCIVIYSGIGFYNEPKEKRNITDTHTLQLILAYSLFVLSLVKIITFLYKTDEIWNLFIHTRIDFLKNVLCRENITILLECRKKSVFVTNLLLSFDIIMVSSWIIFPCIFNTIVGINNPNQRYLNLINFFYPVTTDTFNQYYCIFYVAECFFMVFLLYTSSLTDIFIMSFCWTSIAHYKTITQAFATVGQEKSTEGNHKKEQKCLIAYEDFKSILLDQSNTNLQLKTFYSVVWIIAVSQFAINACSIIIMSYSIILMYLSMAGSFSLFIIIKFIGTIFAIAFEVFMYCISFDVLNTKKENVSFGIYSCNWTAMDIIFKKLMLLSLRIDNANQLKIKITPKKIVNLQLFASMIMTSYNISSVMVKVFSE